MGPGVSPLVQGSGLPGDPVVTHGADLGDARPRPTGLESAVLRVRSASTPGPSPARASTEEPSVPEPGVVLRPAAQPFAPRPPQRRMIARDRKSGRGAKREAWLAELDRRVEARARALVSGRAAAAQELDASRLLRALHDGHRLREVVAERERRRVAEFAPLSPERRVLADAVTWITMELDVLRSLDVSHGVSVERTSRFVAVAERLEALCAREARRAARTAARRAGVPRDEARRASRELEAWVRTGR